MVDFFKFTEQVNLLHPTALLPMKFTAEISDTETIFLDSVVYQGTTFNEKWEKAIIDVKTHFKRKTFQHIHFHLLSPTNCKKMDWQTRSLENPTKKLLWGSISDFEKRLMDRGWPHNFERKIAIRSKIHRMKATLLKQNNKEEKEILPFVTQYKPLVCIIKEALMKKCNLIQNLQLPCHLTLGRTRKIIPPAKRTRGG